MTRTFSDHSLNFDIIHVEFSRAIRGTETINKGSFIDLVLEKTPVGTIREMQNQEINTICDVETNCFQKKFVA